MSQLLSRISPAATNAQLIVSAMAYAHGVKHGPDNERAVLSTGIDQYIQQVFHHLDSDNIGVIEKDDFCILCEILNVKDQTIIENLPAEIDSKEFHERLVQHFMSNLHVNELLQNKHMQKQSSKLLNVDVDIADVSVKTIGLCSQCYQAEPVSDIFQAFSYNYKHDRNDETLPNNCSRLHLMCDDKLQEQCNHMNMQNEALKEVVEDMRFALQTSNARAIAQQVKLSKLRQDMFLSEGQTSWRSSEKDVQRRFGSGTCSGLCKEPEQLRLCHEKYIVYSKGLASDLVRAQREREETEKNRQALLASQWTVRHQLQNTRDALHTALLQVKNLEKRLRTNVRSISVQTCWDFDAMETGITSHENRSSTPGGSFEDSMNCGKICFLRHSGDMAMDRSVEGKSDSDEESMKEWTMKSTKTQNEQTIEQLKQKVLESEEKCIKIEQKYKKMERDLLTEMDRRLQEMEDTHQELQNLQTERLRQNIIENTLSQIIQILRGIKKLGLARRLVGRITLDAVDTCPASDPPDEEADVRNFVHTYHKKLQKVEFLPEIKEDYTHRICPVNLLNTQKNLKTRPWSTNKTTPTKAVQIHTHFYTFSPKGQRSVQV
ncbi:EF-hand and coiled-coil domain-containing protein 1-like [Anneissia japonica]|uniref:EF-hand and coiled-coil domain-containing protein 1-like n=1 Tax=Anneissia japonica TaxID=1529436 RepID=UPI00142558D5|nr:EF-hand and coiled-coil domain-containing protein 1-like [Anneissia japonica]